MFEYSCAQIAEWLGGHRTGPDAPVSGVSYDSRATEPGDLFFALAGEQVDGHHFVDAAFAAGASAAVVQAGRAVAGEGRVGTLISVSDPLAALGRLAAIHRQRYHPRVVGVTGSVGKTTTKDFIASVLSQRYRTLKNSGNLNTEIGVPMTLFSLGPEHEAAVVEMGMRGRGQIRELARIADPDIGVVTRIGLAHLELLGSQDAIAEAKAELLEELPATGTAVVNADDSYSEYLSTRALRSIRYGFGPEADVRCEGLARSRPDDDGGAAFRWSAPAFGIEGAAAGIPLPGRHNVSNALAAVAVGLWMGLTADEIAVGLGEAQVSTMRMEVLHGRDGLTLLNDAYNAASPEAMLAALEVLESQAGGRRQIAVLGNMLELGHASEAAHCDVGEAAARNSGLSLLVTVGDRARGIAQAACDCGMDAEQVIACPDNETALAALERRLRPGDLVLIKGSRGVAMETVVQGLLASRCATIRH